MLIDRVVQGDASALEALYDRHASMILGIALKITDDHPRAEQVLQETFWQAWQSASTYSSQCGSFTGWLYKIARKLAIEVHGRAPTASDD